MISFIKELFSRRENKRQEKRLRECYMKNRFSDKKCYGLTGGDFSTGYLQIECINCPYLSYPNKIQKF